MNINIRVYPKSRRDSVELSPSGDLRVRVIAPPDKGKANDAVVKIIAARLGVPKSTVRVVRGLSSRSKVIEVEGLDGQEAIRRIRSAD